MIAETVLPIVRALPIAEQQRIVDQLLQQLNINETQKEAMSEKQIRKEKRIKWLTENVLFPPNKIKTQIS